MSDSSFGRPPSDLGVNNLNVKETVGQCNTSIRARCIVANSITTNFIDSPTVPITESGTFDLLYDLDLQTVGNITLAFPVDYFVLVLGTQRLVTLTFGEFAPEFPLNSGFVGLSTNTLPPELHPTGPGVRFYAIVRRSVGVISGTSAIEVLNNGQVGIVLQQVASFYGNNSGGNATSLTLTPTTVQWLAGQQPGVHAGATITYVGT